MSKKRLLIAFVVIILIMLSSFIYQYSAGYSYQKQDEPVIKRQIKIIETTMGEVNKENKNYMLQFKGPVKQEWKNELEANGVKFLSYAPEFAYIIDPGNNSLSSIQKHNYVEAVFAFENTDKLKIFDEEKYNFNKDAHKKESYSLFLYNNEKRGAVIEKLNKKGVSVTYEDEEVIHIDAAPDEVEEIALLEEIGAVEQHIPFVVLNDIAGQIAGTSIPMTALNLNGSSQVIGFIDTGVDTGVDNISIQEDIHRDIDNRVIGIYSVEDVNINNASDENGHGTHVVGSAAGSGNRSSGLYKGMAPEAKISFYAAGDDSGSGTIYVLSGNLLKSYFNASYDDGARIHSNSWGSSTSAAYSQEYSKAVDQYVWERNDFLPVYAAGNQGSGQATLVFPGNAKNVLTVGATYSSRYSGNNISQVASFSSRGQTNDGRVKPDVVVPGTSIRSLRPSITSNRCGSVVDAYHSECSGTSMATPIAAGLALLIREDYVINKHISPSASLIKSTIIHGAEDIGYGMGSNETGWGRVNLTKTLFPEQPRYLRFVDNNTGFSNTGEIFEKRINIINNSTPLKITLVWTDNYNDNEGNIVNDLDLVVESEDTNLDINKDKIYYGNDFIKPYDSSTDHVNNVEQVIIEQPKKSTYKITVKAYNINYPMQTFSLVYSGGFDSTPDLSEFDGSTSQFSPDDRLVNVSELILENSTAGKIIWNTSSYYVADADISSAVDIHHNNITINSNTLHTTLLSSATLRLYNLTYSSGVVLKDGKECDSCLIISQNPLTFIASSFSSFTAAENTSLSIWDSASYSEKYGGNTIYANESIVFYANYTNMSSGEIILQSNCSITLDGTTSSMAYNSSINLFVYHTTFGSNDTYTYNMSCYSNEFITREAKSSLTIPTIYTPQKPVVEIHWNESSQNLTLTWNEAKNATNYHVYIRENQYLINNINANSVFNSSSEELSYTINTSNISEQYYAVAAINNDRFSKGDSVGYAKQTYTSGLNFIGLKINITLNASELLNEFDADVYSNITFLDRSDEEAENYVVYEKGSSLNDFVINAGEGYLVYLNKTQTYAYAGFLFNAITLQLISNSLGVFGPLGNNYISLPHMQYETAEEFLDFINLTNSAITKYDSNNKKWISHVKDKQDNNFDILSGEGYEIYVPEPKNATVHYP